MIVRIIDHLVLGEAIGIGFVTPEGKIVRVDLPWDGKEPVTQESILAAIKLRLLRETRQEIIKEVLEPMLNQEFFIDI